MVLVCETAPPAPPSGEPDPACETGCADQLQDCLDETAVVDCQDAEDDCFDLCDPADEACEDLCEASFFTCLSGSVEGACAITLIDCDDDCNADEECELDCEEEYVDCLDEGCNGQFETCSDACEEVPDGGEGGEGDCASVAP